mgnify:CR=1 FL=1
MMEQREFLTVLKQCRKTLTKQERRTLQGQAMAGNVEGAVKGLRKILRRRESEWAEQRPI